MTPRSGVRSASLILALVVLQSQSIDPFAGDAIPTKTNIQKLTGAWVWRALGGGQVPGHLAFSPGCSVMVYIHGNRSYSVWERDSLGDNLLFRGKLAFHNERDWPRFPPAIAVEFRGGWFHNKPHQLITLRPWDRFTSSEGGYKTGRFIVHPPSHAASAEFERIIGSREPPMSEVATGKMRHEPTWVTEVETLRSFQHAPTTPVADDSVTVPEASPDSQPQRSR